jgi:hypothetical protein
VSAVGKDDERKMVVDEKGREGGGCRGRGAWKHLWVLALGRNVRVTRLYVDVDVGLYVDVAARLYVEARLSLEALDTLDRERLGIATPRAWFLKRDSLAARSASRFAMTDVLLTPKPDRAGTSTSEEYEDSRDATVAWSWTSSCGTKGGGLGRSLALESDALLGLGFAFVAAVAAVAAVAVVAAVVVMDEELEEMEEDVMEGIAGGKIGGEGVAG